MDLEKGRQALATILSEHQENLGYSNYEMANYLGMAESTYRGYKNYRLDSNYRISADIAGNIARTLGYGEAEFFKIVYGLEDADEPIYPEVIKRLALDFLSLDPEKQELVLNMIQTLKGTSRTDSETEAIDYALKVGKALGRMKFSFVLDIDQAIASRMPEYGGEAALVENIMWSLNNANVEDVTPDFIHTIVEDPAVRTLVQTLLPKSRLTIYERLHYLLYYPDRPINIHNDLKTVQKRWTAILAIYNREEVPYDLT